jgi:citronellol/citronellal dehydrogenase
VIGTRFGSRRFAAEGADVAIVARTLDQHDHLAGSLRETADRIEQAGRCAALITCDLTDPDDRARVVPEAAEALRGPIDILVNNAAAAIYGPLRDFSLKRRRIVFEVNVHAPLDLAQAVIPSMVERGEGWIVNLSSATARPLPNPTMAVYGASKAALNRLTHGLAVELSGSGIRVNTVEPRAAVKSEGATALVGDTVRADQIESMEEMVEAIVALSDCPAEFSGHVCVSLDLIEQLDLTVHGLDGAPLSSRSE